MATPDEVRASLLASGDHGRDGCARRKVADQVKSTVINGSAVIAFAAYQGQAKDSAEAAIQVATAASAVVLASDLRAPGSTRARRVGPMRPRMADDVNAGEVRMANASDSPFRIPVAHAVDPLPGADAKTVREAIDLLSVLGEPFVAKLAEQAISRITDTDHESRPAVSLNRQGWRARLANVERLLGEAMDATGTSTLTYKKVAEAVAEVRAMIDGDGDEPEPPKPEYVPDTCPTCGADLNETRHGDEHAYDGCPRLRGE